MTRTSGNSVVLTAALTALFACALAAADFGMRSSDECAGSQGDYSAWWDPSLVCRVDPTSGDAALADAAIDEFEGVCSAEADALYQLVFKEWTGWYQTSYVWAGFYHEASNTVGIHHDSMGDSFLWAHEGAHANGIDDEEEADERAEECLQIAGTPRPSAIR